MSKKRVIQISDNQYLVYFGFGSRSKKKREKHFSPKVQDELINNLVSVIRKTEIPGTYTLVANRIMWTRGAEGHIGLHRANRDDPENRVIRLRFQFDWKCERYIVPLQIPPDVSYDVVSTAFASTHY